MTTITDKDDFNQEINCTYKNEVYTVRENCSVLRHPRENGRKRPTDNAWTFGKLNKNTGYREVASVRIHRIVATAFHGLPPTQNHIVHHIDNNKQNNRPENLMWVTRLENILLDPITAKKIALICGSVEAFLANPAKFRDKFQEPNNSWMRKVSKQEAQISLARMQEWAKSDKRPSGGTLDEWIFRRKDNYSEERVEEVFEQVENKTGISRQALCSNKAMRGDYYEARKHAAKLLRSELDLSEYAIGKLLGLSATTINLYLEVSADRYSGDDAEMREKQFKKRFEITPVNYIQKNWTAQSKFPSFPKEVFNNPIAEYAEQIQDNTLFFQTSYYYTTVIQSTIIDDEETLLVMYKISYKDREERWGIMRIIFENEKFVHEIVPNYNGSLDHYTLVDVENHYISIIKGIIWTPLYDSQGKEFKGGYMPL